MRIVGVCPAVLALVMAGPPRLASAEPRDEFAAALQQLATSLGGAYGDEGAAVLAALDRLESALSRWDAHLTTLESTTAREAAAATPASAAELYARLGRELARRGRLADAARQLETAVARDAGRDDVHRLLGVVYEQLGEERLAASAFLAAFQSAPDKPINAYFAVRNKAGGAAATRQAIETLRAWVRTARPAAAASTAPFDAFPLVDFAESGTPLVLPARYAGASRALMAGDYKAAVAAFRAAVGGDPLFSDPARRSPKLAEGSAALREGRLREAREHFRAVIDAVPGSSEAQRLLGVTCWADYDLEASASALREAIRLRPDDERSHVMLVRVLTQAGEFVEAEAAARAAIAAVPDSALAHLWLGSVLVSLNRQLDAADAWSAPALMLLAGSSSMLMAVARQFEGATDFEGVIATLQRAVRANPNHADARAELARAYRDQDRPDEAFAEYAAALLIAPTHPAAYMGIGQIQLASQQYDEAAAVLERLVALQPASHEARYALATALLRSGRDEEARRHLAEYDRLQAAETARRREQLSLEVIKEEATLRFEQGDFARAVALWQQAVEHEPNAAATRVELAEALAAAGRPEAAVEHYERAAALGARPDVYRHLAALYATLGRHAESAAARVRYEQALLVPAGRGAER